MFGEADDQAIVVRQPSSDAEAEDALRALLACPTGSIGAEGVHIDPTGIFPQELAPGVYYTGFNSSKSYGANAFFARRNDGNVLVDSPRWTRHLVRRFEELGGIEYVLLTHRDDVADAERYAAHFGARVFIHEADSDAAPFATDVLTGTDAARIDATLTAIPVPGHTRGSVVFHLDERYLFTGDSLAYSRARKTLTAFRRQCWYSWEQQAQSLERLSPLSFEWVLPGHGDRKREDPVWMREALLALVQRMKHGRG
jgi:glyoxylase-like metal-dependent hydrolase (beta-lactamase superfamily II)